MKSQFKLIRSAQMVTEHKKRLIEQETLPLPVIHPSPKREGDRVPVFQKEPETLILAATQQARNRLAQRILMRLPEPLRQITTRFFEQVNDPYPERSFLHPETETAIVWGWLPGLTLACALGVLSITSGFAVAREGQPGLEITFLLGLSLIFVPTMLRQLSPVTPRSERIATVCIVGLCLYLIKITASPTYFSMYDEFLHWRTADNI